MFVQKKKNGGKINYIYLWKNHIANHLSISIVEATSIWETHLQLLSNNQVYQDEYSNAGSPEIGSTAWAKLFSDDDEITPAEYKLILKYPSEAFKVKSNASIATSTTISTMGFNGHNECSDAFRHCLFQALNTQSIGRGLAKQFGDAHEDGNDPNIPETQMDFHNNWIGYGVGEANPNATADQLATIIMAKLKAGELKILDANGNLISSIGC